MTDRKPSEDLKEGLGLLFRAVRGMAKEATPEAAEKVVSDGAKEMVRVVTDVGKAIAVELEKSFGTPTPKTGDAPPPGPETTVDAKPPAEPPKPDATPGPEKQP